MISTDFHRLRKSKILETSIQKVEVKEIGKVTKTKKFMRISINPNKAGLFKGSFFHVSRRTYLISVQLYTIVKQSI